MTDWYSTKCKLIWKLKGTKYNRVYFQLQVSALPTEEIESGLLPTVQTQGLKVCENRISKAINLKMLPTPTGMMNDCYADNSPNSHLRHSPSLATLADRSLLPTPKTFNAKKQRTLNENGENMSHTTGVKYGVHLTQLANAGMLPTPRANQVNGCNLNSEKLANRNRGNLEETIANWNQKGMIPTPNASDNRNRGNPQDPCVMKRKENGKQVGLTMMVDGQLNPQFVSEMMGFPTDWTELPFLNGETKA
jgi:hypothetical protein